MVHPVPQPPLRGHSASCQPGLCSAWAQGSRYKDTFLCHLLTDPLDPGIWNGEVPPLLCPGAEQQSGRCSLCRRALPRLCLWGRGTAVRCLRQSSRPTVAQPVPLLVQCPRKPQRNRVTPARPVRLGCCRRYSGHLPESPARPGEGSAAHGSKEAPDPTPSGLWGGTGEDTHAWVQPRCHASIPRWGRGRLSLRLKRHLLSAGRRSPPTTGPQEVLDPKGVPELRVPLGKSPSAQLQQPEPPPPPSYQLLPRLRQHLIKSFSQFESVLALGDAFECHPGLDRLRQLQGLARTRSPGAPPCTSHPQGPCGTGTALATEYRGSFGKSLLPSPSRPSQRCFFDLSCRTALCLLPFTAKLVMESLFTGHHCHMSTPAHAACRLPGTWQQPHVCGTDKGLPNRMLGA